MKVFWGNNFGIIALAKNCPEEKMRIIISREKVDNEAISESDFWEKMVKNIVEKKTKFGRIGILFDRKNKEARSFYQTLAKQKYNYTQKNTRAEKYAKFSSMEAQILREMANEGLADSVEFRRILRKYMRNTKHLHLDSIVFLEGIFAEKETRQIIAKTAGTQIKTYFVSDFVDEFELSSGKNFKSSNLKDLNPAKKSFTIETEDNIEFTKKRAEQILQKKLKSSDIKSL